jgi:hypothetical protein
MESSQADEHLPTDERGRMMISALLLVVALAPLVATVIFAAVRK